MDGSTSILISPTEAQFKAQALSPTCRTEAIQGNPNTDRTKICSLHISRWRSLRITRLTISPTRPTRTGSRSPGSTATLQPKGWIRSF
ncbi:hypothetical protein F0562_034895 [Nyssa sinensis]|uniref:Uncharacterized protein n=1 Tax=Nyssa sinensis TaxID=561372 RepID=A0A5J5AA37_9ASTE|nr:hypothetical protein F0562_034895 [Nyssa sinensis]